MKGGLWCKLKNINIFVCLVCMILGRAGKTEVLSSFL